MKYLYDEELHLAKAFSASLPDGRHHITSKKHVSRSFLKEIDPNWFFAIGGFAVWGKGVVDVQRRGKFKAMVLTFEFKLFDRYNWDGGKDVTIGPLIIGDSLMQRFHQQCYAREFDVIGSYRKTYWWNASA